MESTTRTVIAAPNSQIYEKQDSLDSYLSSISPRDKDLLQKTVAKFRPNSKNYEDSWGYIIQSTRNKGLKWYDKSTGFLIFFGKKPDDNKTLVVTSFFAKHNYLKNVVRKVMRSLKIRKTIIKNINPDDVPSLTSLGFRSYRENEYWSVGARFDDQTYPQLIIDLQNVVEAKGPKFHLIRTALRKNPNIVMRKYTDNDKDKILEILATKDGNSVNSKDKTKGMYYSAHAMYPSSETDKYVFIDTATNRIIGFIATSDISPTIAASVASIFLPETRKLGIWCAYQVFLAKYTSGYKMISLGGCETVNTYNYAKEKYRPVEQLQKTHMILELDSI